MLSFSKRVQPRDVLFIAIGAFSTTALLYFTNGGLDVHATKHPVPFTHPEELESGFYEDWSSFEPSLPIKLPEDSYAEPSTVAPTEKDSSSLNNTVVVQENTELLPKTRVLSHAPGWTLFENLYMSNGTLFIITGEEGDADSKEQVTKEGWENGYPLRRMMTSPGQWGYATEESIREREPTDKDMMFITKSEAKKRWVNQVWEVEGHTWLYNDPNQFLGHFYHFVAESLVGFWAMHAGTLDSLITARGETTAPLPSRAIFLRCTPSDIRDSSHFNSYYMHAAFPSISLETSANWDDRVFMTRRGDKVFKFSYALLGDRSASFRGRICGSQNQRIAAEARRVVEDRTTRWWWEPIRRAVLRHANVPEDIVDMPVTSVASFDTGIELSEPKKAFPIVITYINRQGGRRCLRGEDHEVLVRELSQLAQRRGWEFHDVKAQRLTQEEQLTMAARTTVLVGVHGNGLSHLLSMAPTQLSTVIEIFGLGGFMHDYEWTARELGHKYYGIHNDTTFEHPNLPEVAVPESFQSSSIPVQGSLVARLIEKRLDEFMSLLG